MINVLVTVLSLHVFLINKQIELPDKLVTSDSLIQPNRFTERNLFLRAGPFITLKPLSLNIKSKGVVELYLIHSEVTSSTKWTEVSKTKLGEYSGMTLLNKVIYVDISTSYFALHLTEEINTADDHFTFQFANSNCNVSMNVDDSMGVLFPGSYTSINKYVVGENFTCKFIGESQTKQSYHLILKSGRQIIGENLYLNNVANYGNRNNLNGQSVITYSKYSSNLSIYRGGIEFKFELDSKPVIIDDDGAVQVNFNGTWSYIQYGSINEVDAQVLCRESGNATVKSVGYRPMKINDSLVFYTPKCHLGARNLVECSKINKSEMFMMCYIEVLNMVTTLFCHKTYQLRYNGDTSVSFLFNGHWGFVSGIGFGQGSGKVICNQLGYNMVIEYKSAVGTTFAPMAIMQDIACFNANNLNDCSVSIYPNQNNTNKLLIQCSNSKTLIRLADGYHNRGTILLDNEQICGDLFDQHTADLICKELGFINAIEHSTTSRPTPNAIRIICQNTDTSINSCKLEINAKCSSAAVVFCQNIALEGSSASNKGRVELIYQGQRGLLCDDGMNWHTAHVICHQLKFKRAATYQIENTNYGYGNSRFILADLACNSSLIGDINQCNHSNWMGRSCDRNEIVALECDKSSNCTGQGLTAYKRFLDTNLTDFNSESFQSLVLIRPVQSLVNWCSGIIVDIYWILTSASCLTLQSQAIQIIYNNTNRFISQQIIHSQYSDSKGDNNLVLWNIYGFTTQAHMCLHNLHNSNSSVIPQNSTTPLSHLNCSITIAQSETSTKWIQVRLIECHTLSPGLSQERLANYVCSDVDLTETLSGSPLMCNYNGIDMLFGIVNKDVKAWFPVKTTLFTRLDRYATWIGYTIQNY